MDKVRPKRYLLSLPLRGLEMMMACMLALAPLKAQQFPDSPSDTSYFRSGDDDWNLVEAVLRKDTAAVFFLLNRGADPNARSEGGMTALMFAAESGDSALIQLLVLNGADTELSYVEQISPLQIAVLNQHFHAAHYLLQKGANPDHKDDSGGSSLLYAAAENQFQIADLLLFYGASDSIRDRDGNTALLTASWFGNLETVDVLLQNGLDPDGADLEGNTPLMIAAQQGNRDIIDLLLEYGAGLEKKNRANYTPLAHAIRFGQDSAAHLLVESGANIHHYIRPNRNLYDLARTSQQKDLMALLRSKGAHGSGKPDLNEMAVVWGNSFRSREHLMQLRFSLMEEKSGLFAESGFDFRLSYQKVQVEIEPQLIHQYREYRWVWVHGAGKKFRLISDQAGLDYGLYLAVYGMLSMPRYLGVDTHPAVNYNLALSAGAYLEGERAGLKAGADRFQFGTLREGPWKIHIGLYLKIPKLKMANVYKEISY